MLASGLPPLQALAAAGAVATWCLTSALRLTTAPRPDFSTGLVMTEAGAVPLVALATGARGWVGMVAFVAAAGLGTTWIALAATGATMLAWQLVRLARPR